MSGSTTDVLEIIIPESHAGIRLDKVLAKLFPAYSRSQLQQWLKEGRIQVDNQLPLLRQAAQGGEIVRVQVPVSGPSEWQAQDLPLKIVYEDKHLIVLDKPAGFVVHPGAGNPDGTLANALLYRFPETTNLPRAGVVHRLDKDTSGLLVVARTAIARQQLIRDLERHRVVRIYAAIVNGRMLAGGRITQPIGRHPRDRLRMAVNEKGKKAVTEFRVEKRFRAHTQLRVELETGRTHQIRVHFSHRGNPLLSDPRYGGRLRIPKGVSEELAVELRGFRRQALHAQELSFRHPDSGDRMTFSSALPDDLERLIVVLTADQALST